MGDAVTYDRRVLFIVPAANQVAANQAATAFDPTGGSQTFTIGLSPTGLEPATHSWASISMRQGTFEAVEQVIEQNFPTITMVEYDLDTEPNRPVEVAAGMGLQVIHSTDL